MENLLQNRSPFLKTSGSRSAQVFRRAGAEHGLPRAAFHSCSCPIHSGCAYRRTSFHILMLKNLRLMSLPAKANPRPRSLAFERSSPPSPARAGEITSTCPWTSLRQVVPVASFGLRMARHHPLACKHSSHCLARSVWKKETPFSDSYLRHSHPSTAFESPADKELAPNTIPAAALVARLFMFFTTAVTLVGRLCPGFAGMSQAPAQA